MTKGYLYYGQFYVIIMSCKAAMIIILFTFKVSDMMKRNLEFCGITVPNIYTHIEGDNVRIREQFVSNCRF